MEGFLNKQARKELEIAHYLFLSSTTINNYLKRYKSGGLSDLLVDNHLGSECRLTESELKNLSSHLEDRLYQSISAIREYVLSKYAVFFADGTHPQHNTHCSYEWIKKGQYKEIKTNTGRKRVNINGALNAKEPTQIVIDESESIDAKSTVFSKFEYYRTTLATT